VYIKPAKQKEFAMNKQEKMISAIKGRLKDANITRVASGSGVDRATISSLIDGRRMPRKATVIALAVYLGVEEETQ
jgi:transcriptional regulator with XRE-family HTH domain